MNLYKRAYTLVCCSFLLLLASCVKDQDFDQADEIVIAPEVELDLVYLNLNPPNFLNDLGEPELTQVSQTTTLDFLQDAFIQNDLNRIDFTFRSENSFPQAFNTTIRFLDEAENSVYDFSFVVPGAVQGNTASSTYIQVVEGDDLLSLKEAVQLEVVSSIVLSGAPIEGALDFQSKASLYFEFD